MLDTPSSMEEKDVDTTQRVSARRDATKVMFHPTHPLTQSSTITTTITTTTIPATTAYYIILCPYMLLLYRCPLCRATPILVPYETNCGHVYCYTCLWNHSHPSSSAAAGCHVCRARITSCRPTTTTPNE
jgi:hypothetical protein